MGGYYQSTADVTKLGRSILTSSLLPARTTRAWLQATAHTGYAMASIGRPWEILRRNVPVSTGSNTTRVVDLFTKQGGGTAYTTLIAVAPDYGVGLSLLTAGPKAGDFHFIKKLWMDTYLPALEEVCCVSPPFPYRTPSLPGVRSCADKTARRPASKLRPTLPAHTPSRTTLPQPSSCYPTSPGCSCLRCTAGAQTSSHSWLPSGPPWEER